VASLPIPIFPPLQRDERVKCPTAENSLLRTAAKLSDTRGDQPWHVRCTEASSRRDRKQSAIGEKNSMSDYHFTIKLEDISEGAPQVRVWIDDQLAGDLSSEKEIVLVRETRDSWTAQVSTQGSSFIYRVGIFAAPGTRWSLSFRDERDQQELLFDSDELTMPKEWLVGTCEALTLSPHLHARSAGISEAHQ
jgi:hypothetical protein